MKKNPFFYLLALSLTVIGCRQVDENPNDEINPEVAIQYPTLEDNLQVATGSEFNLEGYAEDNTSLQTLNYSVEVVEETANEGEVWNVNREPIPNFTAGEQRHEFSFPIEVPENARHGRYNVIVRAEDTNGNVGLSHTQVVVAATGNGGGGGAPNGLSVNITSPQELDTFFAGNTINVSGTANDPNGWDLLHLIIHRADYKRTNKGWYYEHIFEGAEGETSYNFNHNVTLPDNLPGSGTYYVIVVGESTTGQEIIDTRVVTFRNGNEQNITVTFRLVDVPENTPENETIYMTGYFDDDIPMQRDEDGTYFAVVEMIEGTTLLYNYYRGASNTYEVDSQGNEHPHRYHTFDENEEVEDVVQRWEDHDSLGTGA
jgi:hypothetical protein